MSRFATEFEIEGRQIGDNSPAYIIAEAGISHFGDEEKAYRLVDLASESGADAVKFQVFDVNAMVSKELVEWRERLAPRQLPYKAFQRIQSYCRDKNITFFATAHDEPSLEFLTDIDVPVYKIGSGEVGNWPYLRKVARLGKPVIFSTGMYRPMQITEALDAIYEEGNTEVAVLHCVTSYPTLPSDVSLLNIKLIRERHQVITGYSDHTAGYHIPLAAVALKAKIIEKHITLDFNIPNAQDWKVSCGPDDLGKFIKEVREIEAALTMRDTGPTLEEKKSLEWATKSLFIVNDMDEGSIITEGDLTSKRPGIGISPSYMEKIIGKKIRVSLKKDEMLKWEDLG